MVNGLLEGSSPQKIILNDKQGSFVMKKKILSVTLCILLLFTMLPSAFAKSNGKSSNNSFTNKMQKLYQTPETKYLPETRWWLAQGSHTDETLIESLEEVKEAGFGSVELVTLEADPLSKERYAWGSEEWIHDSELIIKKATEMGLGVSFTSGTHWGTANLMSITPDDEAASQELGFKSVDLEPGQTFAGSIPKPSLPDGVTEANLVRVTVSKITNQEGQLDNDSLTDITDVAVQNGEDWTIDWTAPSNGKYKMFFFWSYGTGEHFEPAVKPSYTINYYSKEGAEELINYWNQEVLTDDILQAVIENGRVNMFMDSLENFTSEEPDTTQQFWTSDFLEEFKTRRGYDLSKYLPLIIVDEGKDFVGSVSYQFNLEGKEELVKKIRNDLFQTYTDLYTEECLDVLREWLNSVGVSLRAQNSYGPHFLEISEPIKSLDYVEGETLTFGSEIDRFRTMAGAAHLYNKVFSSETGALAPNYTFDYNHFLQIINTQFAAGVNRTIMHGYSSKAGPESTTKWPGYEGMYSFISTRTNQRQPEFQDYKDLNTHIARLQKVLQQGNPRMDIGIISTDYYPNNVTEVWSVDYRQNNLRQNKGIYWQDMTLQNAGYTYDYFSPKLLTDDEIEFDKGLVQPDGPGYQALILYQEELPYESAEVIYKWAQGGLPIVIVDGEIKDFKNGQVVTYKGAGLRTPFRDGKDADLEKVMAKLKELDNVAVVDSGEEAYIALQKLDVKPRAEYVDSNQKLLSFMRETDEVSYLYVYNYMYEDEKPYSTQISIDGVFEPYVIDTWSGDVEAIGEYSIEDNRTIVDVTLEPGETLVFALDPKVQEDGYVVDSNVDNVTIVDGKVNLNISKSGTYYAELSNGKRFERKVKAPENIALKNWNLVIEDWQPGNKVTRTEDRGLGYTTKEVYYETNKPLIDVGTTDLIPWKDMEEVGDAVSGIGHYTTNFTIPKNWNNHHGAYLDLGSTNGGTASVYVNGEKAGIVDITNPKIDISKLLVKGDNTLEVQVTSSLNNRMLDLGLLLNIFGGTLESKDYGLTGEANIVTYEKIKLPIEVLKK